MDIKGKRIVITGASRGIGLAIAEACAARGADLYLVSRKLPAELPARLQSLGAAAVKLWEYDLSDMKQVDALAAAAEAIAPEVLVNNAGALTGGLLEDQDPDEIDRMLMVNVHAVIRLTRQLLPGMLRRGRGKIVNNASVSGKMFFPCASTYAASKAAVVAFTESIKQELQGTGVSTLLLITPGVKTEMYDEIFKLYGQHLDLSFLNSIPGSEWAERVVRAIESDQETLWPTGSSRFGVALGHHLPGVLSSLVKGKFKRGK